MANFITARGSDWRYPRAVLSLEQGLLIFFIALDFLHEIAVQTHLFYFLVLVKTCICFYGDMQCDEIF